MNDWEDDNSPQEYQHLEIDDCRIRYCASNLSQNGKREDIADTNNLCLRIVCSDTHPGLSERVAEQRHLIVLYCHNRTPADLAVFSNTCSRKVKHSSIDRSKSRRPDGYAIQVCAYRMGGAEIRRVSDGKHVCVRLVRSRV